MKPSVIVSCLSVFFLILRVHGVYDFTFQRKCPSAPTVKDFDMQKFLGVWYVVSKLRRPSNRIIYQITQPYPIRKPNEYLLQQTTWSRGVPANSYATLTVPEPSPFWTACPSHMIERYPSKRSRSRSQSAYFDVIRTDYTTYAGVYTCRSNSGFNRKSITLLSRTPQLCTPTRREMINEIIDFQANQDYNTYPGGEECYSRVECVANVTTEAESVDVTEQSVANVMTEAGSVVVTDQSVADVTTEAGSVVVTDQSDANVSTEDGSDVVTEQSVADVTTEAVSDVVTEQSVADVTTEAVSDVVTEQSVADVTTEALSDVVTEQSVVNQSTTDASSED